MSIKCNHCGSLVEPNARFCNNCGAQLSTVSEQTQQIHQQAYPPHPFQPQKKSNTNTILVVCLIIFMVVVIAFLAVMMINNMKPEQPQAEKTTETTTTATTNTEQPATQTEEVKAQPKDQLEVLKEQVANRVLSQSEINTLSKNDKRLLRNYIYARHGYIFKDSQLSNYFKQYNWYSGRYTSAAEVEKQFNSYEQKNVAQLVDGGGSSTAYSNTPSVSPGTYHTFIGHCNIRANSTSSSPIIATAEDGEMCYVHTNHRGDWYIVTLSDGTQGWTHRQNLRIAR